MRSVECLQAERLFDAYLDREITAGDSAALHRHLATCPRCNDAWLATRKMSDLMAALPSESPGPELFSRIMMRLPAAKARRRPLRLSVWQAAAAAAVACLLAGAAFVTGSRQMIAAAVENRQGKAVVVPRPGRPLVIPPGATVLGDLRVAGDAWIQGKVSGGVWVEGRLRGNAPEGFLARCRRAVAEFWRRLSGRPEPQPLP